MLTISDTFPDGCEPDLHFSNQPANTEPWSFAAFGQPYAGLLTYTYTFKPDFNVLIDYKHKYSLQTYTGLTIEPNDGLPRSENALHDLITYPQYDTFTGGSGGGSSGAYLFFREYTTGVRHKYFGGGGGFNPAHILIAEDPSATYGLTLLQRNRANFDLKFGDVSIHRAEWLEPSSMLAQRDANGIAFDNANQLSWFNYDISARMYAESFHTNVFENVTITDGFLDLNWRYSKRPGEIYHICMAFSSHVFDIYTGSRILRLSYKYSEAGVAERIIAGSYDADLGDKTRHQIIELGFSDTQAGLIADDMSMYPKNSKTFDLAIETFGADRGQEVEFINLDEAGLMCSLESINMDCTKAIFTYRKIGYGTSAKFMKDPQKKGTFMQDSAVSIIAAVEISIAEYKRGHIEFLKNIIHTPKVVAQISTSYAIAGGGNTTSKKRVDAYTPKDSTWSNYESRYEIYPSVFKYPGYKFRQLLGIVYGQTESTRNDRYAFYVEFEALEQESALQYGKGTMGVMKYNRALDVFSDNIISTYENVYINCENMESYDYNGMPVSRCCKREQSFLKNAAGHRFDFQRISNTVFVIVEDRSSISVLDATYKSYLYTGELLEEITRTTADAEDKFLQGFNPPKPYLNDCQNYVNTKKFYGSFDPRTWTYSGLQDNPVVYV